MPGRAPKPPRGGKNTDKFHVKDTDKGWDAVMKSFENFRAAQPELAIGVVGPEGLRTHALSKKGENVATIAAKNEFGVGVPERSFLRSTFDLNGDDYGKYVSRGLGKEILRAAESKSALAPDSSLTLKRIALKVEGDIKKRIGDRQIPPPNAPSTIAHKGSSTPLIWTGQMRRAITSAVRRKTNGGGAAP